jgi:hypothetical protein
MRGNKRISVLSRVSSGDRFDDRQGGFFSTSRLAAFSRVRSFAWRNLWGQRAQQPRQRGEPSPKPTSPLLRVPRPIYSMCAHADSVECR